MKATGRRRADERLILDLAAGLEIREAAARAGVAESTVYRRLRLPEFRSQVTAARSAIVERATGRLVDASTRAVDKLVGLLNAESATVALGAAKAILELGVRYRETNELETRIQELEERLNHEQSPRQSHRAA